MVEKEILSETEKYSWTYFHNDTKSIKLEIKTDFYSDYLYWKKSLVPVTYIKQNHIVAQKWETV